MVCKDEVCLWFKDNEPHRRLELLCGLLNMCLPMELRFISTCVEDLGKRDFYDLREAEYKANNIQEITRLSNLLDERTRSNVIVYVALLSSRNHTCSTLLYQILAEAQQTPLPTDVNYIKEMLLIYTMVLHHPAFTFEQKRVIADLHSRTCRAETQLCQQRSSETELMDALSQTCSPVAEGCDSGLSVGTEPEGDALLDGCGLLPTPGSQLHHHYHHHSHSLPSATNSKWSGTCIGGGGENHEYSTGGHGVSQTTGDSGGSQDACSSGSGESSELYNESGTVSTTYIYNSSIFDQQGLAVALTMAPSYPCNHPGNFHYYQYPQMVGTVPGCVPSGKRSNSEGSSSEEGGGLATHNGPPASNSPLSSPQSSPYVSPLQSLSPSRASSPLSRPTTTTTTTTTTTAANLPLTITSSTTTASACVISTHSSPQLAHKHSVTTQTVTATTQAGISHTSTHPGTTSSGQTHRGKPPSSGGRSQRQSDRSGSRTRLPGGSAGDVEATVGNHNSPSGARGVIQTSLSFSNTTNHTKSSRWPGNCPAIASSTSSSSSCAAPTGSIKNVTRQNSQSPSPMSGTTTTCRIGVTATVTASSSACKTTSISSHVVSGSSSSTPISLSATQTTRNTSPLVVQGGNQEKSVHVSSNSGIRPPSSTGGSISTNQPTLEKPAVNNNNCLNLEFVKNERLNKYYQQLADYPIDTLKKMSDRELIDMVGLTKGALTKLRRVLAGIESPAPHIPNGFTNPSSIALHPRSTPHPHHTSYNPSHNSIHNHSVAATAAHTSLNSQSTVHNSLHSTMPSHSLSSTSSDTLNTHSYCQTSTSNTQTSSQNALQNTVSETINTCSNNKTSQGSLNSPTPPVSSHKGACPQSSCITGNSPTTTTCSTQTVSSTTSAATPTITTSSSTSTSISSSSLSSSSLSGSPASLKISSSSSPSSSSTSSSSSSSSSPSSNNNKSANTISPSTAIVVTTSRSVVLTTTTTANIVATTHVTQCHSITHSHSPKGAPVIMQQPPCISSAIVVGTSPANSISIQGAHSTCISSSTTSTSSGSVPASVSPITPVPHYMTTPPPPIHHKTPPPSAGSANILGQHHIATQLPPGQHRTPPPPLCPPPRTPSREPPTPSTSTGLTMSNGVQQVYYTCNNGHGGKSNPGVSSSNMGVPASAPLNMTGYTAPVGMTLPQPSPVGSVAMPIYTSAGNMPVYTSSGSIGVPPPGNGGLVPMVPPGGQFPPAYLYSPLGAPGGTHTYVPPGYAAQHPHRSFFLPHIPPIGPMAHLKATPHHHGTTINSGYGSRGGSSSSSCSSSSGSTRGFHKGNPRGHGHMKNCSRSSDSSPSSSQYSSPPQTPSPDHTRDNHTDKRGKTQVDGVDICENGDSLGLLGSGASEGGTPPPLHHPPNPILLPPQANLTRHRLMPYHHLGYVNFHQGMIRYPSLPLQTQTPVVAPRNPVPLNSDKTSRETTPPAPGAVPLVQQDPQCCMRSPSEGSMIPSTLTGNNLGRNGGSPHTAASHPDGPHPPGAHTPVPSVASAPTAQVPPGNSCSGVPHSSVQYNPPGYPVVMSAPMFPQFPGFMPAHSSALSNGFVSSPLPPNFAFPAMGNGLNAAEFVYSSQYPVLGGTTQGGGGPGTACGTPTGIGPPSTPGPGLAAGLPYTHYPPTMPHTPNPSAGAKKSCYNCGQVGHHGAECKEANIEEMCNVPKTVRS
ncbi:mucin-12-like isoform X3 [Homarus americanus]|uniref:mucin-12-like isoform X3 n=1 Tax=Homarus americanus TaxID=6706 RepID=UPI001C4790CD|nr:mucin-12-like isoform X3 [Homarus americanus]